MFARESVMSDGGLMCPSVAILSNWSVQDWGRADGVQIETRQDFDRLLVRTENSLYELIVQCGAKGDVLVRGGRFFPAFTKIQLAGSSLGGSFLKRLGIYVGLRMEFFANGDTIVTSAVRSISMCPLESPSDRSIPH
jgi:hypothetical protein